MQEHMYKIKLDFSSLTWVSLKLNFQLETNFEDGSRETELLKELFRDRGCQLKKINILSLTWIWLKLNSQLKNQRRTTEAEPEIYIQSQTHCFEFDLSLTEIQYSTN